MQADPQKVYLVKLESVKWHFRQQFQRPALIFKFEIPELLTTTTRTLNFPKTLDRKKAKPGCKFQQVVGSILQREYSDGLLFEQKALARVLHSDLAGKTFKAHLRDSPNGHYIDVEVLVPMEEEAS